MWKASIERDGILRRLREALWPPRSHEDSIRAQAARQAPVVWMIGKVQSGKTSIIRALTAATAAEIGSGFMPCTRTARVFDFPADAPLIRFLDTRGLGEVDYTPDPDIAFAESQSHLLIVVMRAMDPDQQVIVDVVRQVRQRHPEWPILGVHTSLHDVYLPRQQHPDPYPFDDCARPSAPSQVPEDLARAIAFQQRLFAAIPGQGQVAFCAVDFTQPGDGFEPELYGLDACKAALLRVGPSAIATILSGENTADEIERRANPHILGFATAAAAADVVPIAGAVAVPGIQAKLLHNLSSFIHRGCWFDSVDGDEAVGFA